MYKNVEIQKIDHCGILLVDENLISVIYIIKFPKHIRVYTKIINDEKRTNFTGYFFMAVHH